MCDSCGKAFRVAANFYAHRKTHRKPVEKISLDAAVAEIGQFIEEQQQQPADEEEQQQQIHTLQMAQPVMNDALSQAIQEHLTQSGLVGHVHPLDGFNHDPSSSATMLAQYHGAAGGTSDGIDYASSVHPEQPSSTPGYLKDILMGPYEDK